MSYDDDRLKRARTAFKARLQKLRERFWDCSKSFSWHDNGQVVQHMYPDDYVEVQHLLRRYLYLQAYALQRKYKTKTIHYDFPRIEWKTNNHSNVILPRLLLV